MSNLEFKNISVSDIFPDKNQPRKYFDDAAIIELSESIKEKGVLQPILVREQPDRTGKYDLVAGERRWRATKLAKIKTIPAIVREITDEEVFELQILENLQREDISPVDEAKAFEQILKKETVQWLADKLHKSPKYVLDRIKLNSLNAVGLHLLHIGKLPLTHAIMISKLTPEFQIQALKECFRYVNFTNDNYSEEDYSDVFIQCNSDVLSSFIETLFIGFEKAPFNLESNQYSIAGPCSTCPKRTCNQNLLFQDITANDLCTDVSCFNVKIAEHVEEQIKYNKQFENTGVGKKLWSSSNGIEVKGEELTYSEVADKKMKNCMSVVITRCESKHDSKHLGKIVYVDFPLPAVIEKKKAEKAIVKENDSMPYDMKQAIELREEFVPLVLKCMEDYMTSNDVLLDLTPRTNSLFRRQAEWNLKYCNSGIVSFLFNTLPNIEENTLTDIELYNRGHYTDGFQEALDKFLATYCTHNILLFTILCQMYEDEEHLEYMRDLEKLYSSKKVEDFKNNRKKSK